MDLWKMEFCYDKLIFHKKIISSRYMLRNSGKHSTTNKSRNLFKFECNFVYDKLWAKTTLNILRK